MEKFQKTFDDWCEINKKLYAECKEYLSNVISKEENNYVSLEDADSICVSYNGGRHPEYASNCFSTVNAVYMKDGDIYLDIEDTNEYSIDNIDAYELSGVAECVFNLLNEK